MSLLEVKELKMYYKLSSGWVKAVDDVSFKLGKGRTLGLVGESGCGKTSVAMAIMRLLPFNAQIMGGNINLEGTDLTKLTEDEIREVRWKKVSMIFQGAMNAFNPVFKVGDQLVEAILTHENVTDKEAKKRVINLFELVGLQPDRMNNYPHEFSGGMKQRAIIAMSLACNPHLVIADEPTTALDVVMQDQILNEINKLQQDFKLALIVISHDISVIAETCHEIAIMYGGKIFEIADATSIFHNPHNPYTIGLLNSFPTLRGPKRKLVSIRGSPPNLMGEKEGCLFEPRCPYAKPVCKEEVPTLTTIDSRKNHHSRCHFALDPKLQDIEFKE